MKASLLKNKVNTKTLNYVLLSVATLGLFNFMWLYKNNKIIGEVLEEKIFNSSTIIVLVSLSAWSSALSSNFSTGGESTVSIVMSTVSILLSIAAGVLTVSWAFKAKKSLQKMMLDEYKIDYKMNSFYTIIFNTYYINFCINDIENEISKSKALSEAPAV